MAPVGGDASFNFGTNIEEIVRLIESGLARIDADARQVGQGTGGAAGNFMPGFEQRISKMIAEVDRLKAAATVNIEGASRGQTLASSQNDRLMTQINKARQNLYTGVLNDIKGLGSTDPAAAGYLKQQLDSAYRQIGDVLRRDLEAFARQTQALADTRGVTIEGGGRTGAGGYLGSPSGIASNDRRFFQRLEREFDFTGFTKFADSFNAVQKAASSAASAVQASATAAQSAATAAAAAANKAADAVERVTRAATAAEASTQRTAAAARSGSAVGVAAPTTSGISAESRVLQTFSDRLTQRLIDLDRSIDRLSTHQQQTIQSTIAGGTVSARKPEEQLIPQVNAARQAFYRGAAQDIDQLFAGNPTGRGQAMGELNRVYRTQGEDVSAALRDFVNVTEQEARRNRVQLIGRGGTEGGTAFWGSAAGIPRRDSEFIRNEASAVATGMSTGPVQQLGAASEDAARAVSSTARAAGNAAQAMNAAARAVDDAATRITVAGARAGGAFQLSEPIARTARVPAMEQWGAVLPGFDPNARPGALPNLSDWLPRTALPGDDARRSAAQVALELGRAAQATNTTRVQEAERALRTATLGGNSADITRAEAALTAAQASLQLATAQVTRAAADFTRTGAGYGGGGGRPPYLPTPAAGDPDENRPRLSLQRPYGYKQAYGPNFHPTIEGAPAGDTFRLTPQFREQERRLLEADRRRRDFSDERFDTRSGLSYISSRHERYLYDYDRGEYRDRYTNVPVSDPKLLGDLDRSREREEIRLADRRRHAVEMMERANATLAREDERLANATRLVTAIMEGRATQLKGGWWMEQQQGLPPAFARQVTGGGVEYLNRTADAGSALVYRQQLEAAKTVQREARRAADAERDADARAENERRLVAGTESGRARPLRGGAFYEERLIGQPEPNYFQRTATGYQQIRPDSERPGDAELLQRVRRIAAEESAKAQARTFPYERDLQQRQAGYSLINSETVRVGSTYRDRASGRELEEGERQLTRAMVDEAATMRRVEQASQELANYQRLYAAQLSGAARHISGNLYEDRTNPEVPQYYRLTAGGARVIDQYGDPLRYEETRRQVDSRPNSIRQSFARGLTASSFGNGASTQLPAAGLAQAAGNTVKYSALYDSLNMVQNALQQVIIEIANYEDSIANLELAYRGTEGPSRDFVMNLSEIAQMAGANLGDVMDQAAVGMRAFAESARDATGALDPQALERFGAAFAKQVAVNALVTGATYDQASEDIRASASAFRGNSNSPVTNEDFTRINDAIAGAKDFGGDANDISRGVSALATAGEAAGLTINQIAAIVSQGTAQLGESGELFASRFSRVLAIFGGSEGQNAIAELNESLNADYRINTEADVRTQALQLGRAVNAGEAVSGLGDTDVQQLTSSLGGTANTREFLTFVRGAAETLGEDLNYAGRSSEEYARRSQDLVGLYRRLTGAVIQIINSINTSGVLLPLVVAFNGIVRAAELFSGGILAMSTAAQKFSDAIVEIYIQPLADALSPLKALADPLHALNANFLGLAAAAVAAVAAIKTMSALRNAGGVRNLISGGYIRTEAALRPADALARAELRERAEGARRLPVAGLAGPGTIGPAMPTGRTGLPLVPGAGPVVTGGPEGAAAQRANASAFGNSPMRVVIAGATSEGMRATGANALSDLGRAIRQQYTADQRAALTQMREARQGTRPYQTGALLRAQSAAAGNDALYWMSRNALGPASTFDDQRRMLARQEARWNNPPLPMTGTAQRVEISRQLGFFGVGQGLVGAGGPAAPTESRAEVRARAETAKADAREAERRVREAENRLRGAQADLGRVKFGPGNTDMAAGNVTAAREQVEAARAERDAAEERRRATRDEYRNYGRGPRSFMFADRSLPGFGPSTGYLPPDPRQVQANQRALAQADEQLRRVREASNGDYYRRARVERDVRAGRVDPNDPIVSATRQLAQQARQNETEAQNARNAAAARVDRDSLAQRRAEESGNDGRSAYRRLRDQLRGQEEEQRRLRGATEGTRTGFARLGAPIQQLGRAFTGLRIAAIASATALRDSAIAQRARGFLGGGRDLLREGRENLNTFGGAALAITIGAGLVLDAYNATKRFNEAGDSLEQALSTSAIGATGEESAANAEALRANTQALEDASKGIWANIADFLAVGIGRALGNQDVQSADERIENASRYSDAVARYAQQQRDYEANPVGDTALNNDPSIDFSSSDALSNSISELQDSGRNASSIFDVLRARLLSMTDAARTGALSLTEAQREMLARSGRASILEDATLFRGTTEIKVDLNTMEGVLNAQRLEKGQAPIDQGAQVYVDEYGATLNPAQLQAQEQARANALNQSTQRALLGIAGRDVNPGAYTLFDSKTLGVQTNNVTSAREALDAFRSDVEEALGHGPIDILRQATTLGGPSREVRDQIVVLDQALAELVRGGHIDEAASAFNRLKDAAVAGGMSEERFESAFVHYRGATTGNVIPGESGYGVLAPGKTDGGVPAGGINPAGSLLGRIATGNNTSGQSTRVPTGEIVQLDDTQRKRLQDTTEGALRDVLARGVDFTTQDGQRIIRDFLEARLRSTLLDMGLDPSQAREQAAGVVEAMAANGPIGKIDFNEVGSVAAQLSEAAAAKAEREGLYASINAGADGVPGSAYVAPTLGRGRVSGTIGGGDLAAAEANVRLQQQVYDDLANYGQAQVDAITDPTERATAQEALRTSLEAQLDRIAEAKQGVIPVVVQNLQLLGEMAVASIPAGDQVAQLDAQLNTLQQIFNTQTDARDRNQTYLQAVQTAVQRSEAAFADRQASALADIDPESDIAYARQARDNAQAQVDRLARGFTVDALGNEVAISGQARTQATAQAQETLRQSTKDLAAREQAARLAQRRSTLRSDQTLAADAIDVDAARAEMERLGAISTQTEAYFAAVGAYNQAVEKQAQDTASMLYAQRLAGIDPRDAIALANAAVERAEQELTTLDPNEQAYQDKLTEIAQLRLDAAQKTTARDSARARAGVNPRAGMASASVQLDRARVELRDLRYDTTEYWEKISEITSDMMELADSITQNASNQRQLRIDLTNPVATAQEDLTRAREAVANTLAQLVANNTPQDQIDEIMAPLYNAVREAETNVDAQQFSQRLNDIQHAERVGKITQAAYLQYLQSEHDRLTTQIAGMDATTNGYRQAVEQLQQIDELIYDAKNSLRQEFNLNDVQLPTLYEVRRAVGVSADQIRSQVVDYSSTQGTVIINGADMATVINYINKTLGTGSTAVYTTSPRRV